MSADVSDELPEASMLGDAEITAFGNLDLWQEDEEEFPDEIEETLPLPRSFQPDSVSIISEQTISTVSTLDEYGVDYLETSLEDLLPEFDDEEKVA